MTFGGKSRNKAEQARSKTAEFDWSRVDRVHADYCWEWMGPLNTWGYGDCKWSGKRVNASRAAYEATHGPLAAGMVVCHRCDNRACCNPAHLWADTQANNLADCRDKGRQVYLTGAEHHRTTAKLTEEKVREARALYASGVSQSEIARRWGMHSSTISRAVRGEFWKHIT